jgi:hypothetical protein
VVRLEVTPTRFWLARLIAMLLSLSATLIGVLMRSNLDDTTLPDTGLEHPTRACRHSSHPSPRPGVGQSRFVLVEMVEP